MAIKGINQLTATLANRFDSEITTARNDQLNVLSPKWFERAEKSLNNARDMVNRGDEISEIFQQVAEGREQLNTAQEMAQVARTTLPDVIDSRSRARAAGATQLAEYDTVEQDFMALTRAIENNNLRTARRDRDKVKDAFQAIELKAIKENTIGEVRRLLKKAEQEEADENAPASYALAKKSLQDTDQFITNNPYEKEQMKEMADEALFYAQRLIHINNQSRTIADMTPERVALWMEGLIQQVTSELSAPDMRNQSFQTQTENIVGYIAALEADRDFMVDKAKSQQLEIEQLMAQVEMLRGQTEAERLEKERLAAEKEFNLRSPTG